MTFIPMISEIFSAVPRPTPQRPSSLSGREIAVGAPVNLNLNVCFPTGIYLVSKNIFCLLESAKILSFVETITPSTLNSILYSSPSDAISFAPTL